MHDVVDAEPGDVDLDEVRNLRRQTLDLELAQDRLQDAAVDDALRPCPMKCSGTVTTSRSVRSTS